MNMSQPCEVSNSSSQHYEVSNSSSQPCEVSNSSSQQSNNDTEFKITGNVKYIKPVAVWGYDIENDLCDICKSKLTSKCIDCISKLNVIDNSCSISKGKCGHAFHYHCIIKWH